MGVAGIHHTASYLRSASEPAPATCLAKAGVADLRVADFADGGVALTAHQANLSGWQLQSDVIALLGHHLSTGSGSSDHLSTATGIKLDAVNAGTKGNVRERHGVADLDGRFRPR